MAELGHKIILLEDNNTVYMQSQLPLGRFVTVQNCDLGIGKLVELDESKAKVEWFTSISQHTSQPDIREYDRELVRRARPPKQTRCYLADEFESSWQMGRIQEISPSQSGTGVEYEVHLPNKGGGYYPEGRVFVRCSGPPVDSTETLTHHHQETPFFHYYRSRFLDSIIQQRATAHGLTGLVSSRIQLYPHQIEVVRRVLEDPVQRYLLADEVGLGKTIEAGAILRQAWLDDPSSRALVIVPRELEAQWRLELEDRFALDTEGEFVTLCVTDRIQEYTFDEAYDIVVIDEAHHVAAASRQPYKVFLWETCRRLAHSAPRLLLLSATPALRHEQDFLAMLHLLEKETYRLDGIDAFERRVRERQRIGRLLLLFREGMSRSPLRRCLGELRELFDGDEWGLSRVETLQDYCDAQVLDREQADLIIRELRVHICETYRLYRRMLRSSRESVSSISSNVVSPRATKYDDPPVIEEWGFDERLSTLSRLLDEWRTNATGVVWLAEESDRESIMGELIRVFMILLESSGTWLEVLATVIKCRLAGGNGTIQYDQVLGQETAGTLASVPLIQDEDVILRAMLSELSRDSEEGDQFDTLIDVISRHQSHATIGSKCVVFTSHTMVGHEITRRLSRALGSKRVVSHLRSDSLESLRAGFETFRDSDRPMILVCDQSGEEGLNLQFADLLIHFDLLWAPNRIEQRIGRFDRVGRSEEVPQRVFVALGDGDDDISLHDVWFRLLKNGFRVFSQSIADLQFFIDKAMPKLREKAFMEGAQGLANQLVDLEKDIAEERRLLREQTTLDEIEAFDRDYVDFRTLLAGYDIEEKAIQNALDGWAKDILRMKRLFPVGAERYSSPATPLRQQLVRYEATEFTLVPTDWARRLNSSQSGFGAFSRRIACAVADTAVLRIGHPFVDSLTEYIAWDDRGKSFACWRCISGANLDHDCIFFQLDYIVEADVDPVGQILHSGQSIGKAVHALSRKADGWFPPQRWIIFVDQDMQIVENPEMLEILNKPFPESREDERAYNLNLERQWALDEIISPDRWTELCRKVRQFSEQIIRTDRAFMAHCQESAERAKHELERRMEQLRRGLVYGTEVGIEANTIGSIDSFIKEERQLYEALIRGIEQPSVRLDAVGAIVISNRDPFR